MFLRGEIQHKNLWTVDLETGLARVICGGGSQKVRNVNATGIAVVSQNDGRWWSTIEGKAVVRTDAESVAEAVSRYAVRYRQPRVNPERVAIEIQVMRVLGPLRPPFPALLDCLIQARGMVRHHCSISPACWLMPTLGRKGGRLGLSRL